MGIRRGLGMHHFKVRCIRADLNPGWVRWHHNFRAFFCVLVMCAIGIWGKAEAAEWNVGVKRLTLHDPVVGGAMTGIVTYPTPAASQRITIGRFEIKAAQDGAPAEGRFPLVIVSHGTGGLPEMYLWLFEGLAMKGFIVAGVAHSGDNYNDRSGSLGDALFVDRTRHVSALIDFLVENVTLSQAIDARKIGIAGHSAGGYTALLSAGGAPDFSQFAGRCRTNSEQNRGTRWTHDPAKSPVIDARIRAAAVMAPALACLFDKESLRDVSIPVRIYQADLDEVLQPGFNATYFSALLAKAPETAHVANAGHFVFMNTCPFIMSMIARQICSDPSGTDRAEVHRYLIEEIALFFRQNLDIQRP